MARQGGAAQEDPAPPDTDAALDSRADVRRYPIREIRKGHRADARFSAPLLLVALPRSCQPLPLQVRVDSEAPVPKTQHPPAQRWTPGESCRRARDLSNSSRGPDPAAKAAAQRQHGSVLGVRGQLRRAVDTRSRSSAYWVTPETSTPQDAFYQRREGNEAARVCIDGGDLNTAERMYRAAASWAQGAEPIPHPRSLWITAWPMRWRASLLARQCRRCGPAAGRGATHPRLRFGDGAQQARLSPYSRAMWPSIPATSRPPKPSSSGRPSSTPASVQHSIARHDLRKAGQSDKRWRTIANRTTCHDHNPPAAFSRPFALPEAGHAMRRVAAGLVPPALLASRRPARGTAARPLRKRPPLRERRQLGRGAHPRAGDRRHRSARARKSYADRSRRSHRRARTGATLQVPAARWCSTSPAVRDSRLVMMHEHLYYPTGPACTETCRELFPLYLAGA